MDERDRREVVSLPVAPSASTGCLAAGGDRCKKRKRRQGDYTAERTTTRPLQYGLETHPAQVALPDPSPVQVLPHFADSLVSAPLPSVSSNEHAASEEQSYAYVYSEIMRMNANHDSRITEIRADLVTCFLRNKQAEEVAGLLSEEDREKRHLDWERSCGEYRARLQALESDYALVLRAYESVPRVQESPGQSSEAIRCAQLPVLGRVCTRGVGLSQMRLPVEAFGVRAWRECFGVDVGQEPALPADIETILNAEAPFLLEDEQHRQRVRDNHVLTLIPGVVDGELFTLDRLGALLLYNRTKRFNAFQNNNSSDLGSKSHGYRYYSETLTSEIRQAPLSTAPYWLLLSKTILRDSRNKSFAEQAEQLSRYHEAGYRMPYALEVATSLLCHYAQSGTKRECLYANQNDRGLWTYTRCLNMDANRSPVSVGGFGPLCLPTQIHIHKRVYHGVSACRKL